MTKNEGLPLSNPNKMGYINPAMVESNDRLTMAILNGGTYVSYLMSELSGAKFQSKEFKTSAKAALDLRLNEINPNSQSDKPFREALYGGDNSLHSINLDELKSPDKKVSRPNYRYGSQDYSYTLKKGGKDTKTDYKPLEDGITQAIYRAAKGLDLTTVEYNPIEKELTPRQTLETLAYSVIADRNAQQPLHRNAQHYIVTDGKYTLSLSEGYIDKLDLRYLIFNIRTEEEEQTYHLLIKKRKDVRITEDKGTAKELEELLKNISKKSKIVDEDVMKTLAGMIKKRELELTEEQIEIIRKTKQSKKAIWFMEGNKTKKIEIKKALPQPAKEYLKKPAIIEYPQDKQYLEIAERKRKDFTHNVPAKDVHKFPISMMGGILGFTYLGDSFVGIRDDLNDYESHEVEIHEAIHTPDEYETRQIVRWMLDNETTYH